MTSTEATVAPPQRASAEAAARAGLDFLVRHQCKNPATADFGRFPFAYQCDTAEAKSWTTNWTTGVITEALLSGHRYFDEPTYKEAAERAIDYLCALQEFSPTYPKMYGALREETPQMVWMHPRDALTGACAMLNAAGMLGRSDLMQRAELFGQWFVTHGMLDGYPYWTARFDDQVWEPMWFGSFHSGSAYFMNRLYRQSGDRQYLSAARQILEHYNTHHLDENGNVVVIRDRQTLERLDGHVESFWTNRTWEVMHVYNDDFGALANLAMFRTTSDRRYADAAGRFLRNMAANQHDSGGFGPEGWAIPSAAGVIAIEMLAARSCDLDLDLSAAIERTITYLIDLQYKQEGPSHGAFLSFSDDYKIDGKTANARTGSYAVLALLRYLGATDQCYAIPA